MSVTIAGSIALDDIVTHDDGRIGVPGGSALYAAVAASLFSPVNLVGIVGGDFPVTELEFLVERHVDLDNVMRFPEEATFRWSCEYDADMHSRKTTLLSRNVHEHFQPRLNESARSAPVAFLGSLDPDIQLEICGQLDDSVFVVADTIECYLKNKTDRFHDVMRAVDLTVISDSEAMSMTGETSIVAAARLLAERCPGRLIIKKGEHGSFLVSDDSLFLVPAYPVDRCVDPTGAGDVYSGSIAGYLAVKKLVTEADIREAMLYGTLVSSFLVGDFSYSSLRHLTTTGIEERMKEFRRMTLLWPDCQRKT